MSESSDADTDDRELTAVCALSLRADGHGFRQIGEALGVSGGHAHHLYRAGLQLRAERARALARGPGRTGAPTPERARELLERVRFDHHQLHELALTYVDPEGAGERGLESQALGRLANAFEDSCVPLSRDGHDGLPDDTVRAVRTAFVEVLRWTAERDPTLLQEVGPRTVLEAADRDLRELANIIGGQACDWPSELDPIEPRFVVETPAPINDAETRRRRNERIVAARLGGTPVREVAGAAGVEPRHVRRIMQEHRKGQYMVSQEMLDIVRTSLSEIQACCESLEADGEDDDVQRELIGLRGRLIGELTRAGFVSGESLQDSRGAVFRDRLDQTERINDHLREVGARHDLAPQVLEELTDSVIDAQEIFSGGP